jgi:hypothetical protein
MDADPIERRWPGLWSILNRRARGGLPAPLAEYAADAREGAAALCLDLAERELQFLFDKCGKGIVCDVYRRRVSSLRDESQLRAFLFELYVCASVATVCDDFHLVRPQQERRTPEFEATLRGERLCGEVKRHPWKEDGPLPDINEVRLGTFPRAQSLASKLDDELRPKFVPGAANIGFIYRRSGGDVYPPRAFVRSILAPVRGPMSPGRAERTSDEDVRCALSLAYRKPGWDVVSGVFSVQFPLALSGNLLSPEVRWFANCQATVPLSPSLAKIVSEALSRMPG